MEVPNNGIDPKKLEDYKSHCGYKDFMKWFNAHKNTNKNIRAMLENIDNTPENKRMISVYKALRYKVYNGIKYTVKLQGRGCRKGFNYDSANSLRLTDSERFSLYFYQVW